MVIHRNSTCFGNIDRPSLEKVCQVFGFFYIKTERRKIEPERSYTEIILRLEFNLTAKQIHHLHKLLSSTACVLFKVKRFSQPRFFTGSCFSS